MASRDSVNVWISWISASAALGSLILGGIHKLSPKALQSWVGPVVVGLWVLLPPIWFWSEWVWFSRSLSHDERERVQHLHDLSRNIWLAVIAVLITLFDLKVFRP